MVFEGLEVSQLEADHVPTVLDHGRDLLMIDTHVVPAEVVQKRAEGLLELGVAVLAQYCLLRVKVLVREIDALPVHLKIIPPSKSIVIPPN